MARIGITKFAARHFDPEFKGTKIGDMSPEEFVNKVNEVEHAAEAPGYAPFCRHVFVKNFTDACAGVAKITPDNEGYLKSGYEARREGELPILTRWFEGVEAPRAAYLDLVLYSKEQLEAEAAKTPDMERDVPDEEWSIVAILGVMSAEEEPMSPATMTRNALGKEEGGSGHKLDKEAYGRAVEFWGEHALVR